MKLALQLLALCSLSSVVESNWTATTAPQQYGKGLKLPPAGTFKPRAGLQAVPIVATPAAYDFRTVYGDLPVKNQQSCGSCWAFTTVATVEYQIKKKTGNTVDLSEQQLVSCDRAFNTGCNGGWWSDAYDYYLKTKQPVSETCYPYINADGTCTASSCSSDWTVKSWGFVSNNWEIPSVAQMKSAIYQYGPIAVGVDANAQFGSYSSGIFDVVSAPSAGVNHAVVLVGWDDSQGYWIMRNSWSTSWGEKGYMRIKYTAANIGYAAAYVVADPVVTPVTCPNYPGYITKAQTNWVAAAGASEAQLTSAAAAKASCDSNPACTHWNNFGYVMQGGVSSYIPYTGLCIYSKLAVVPITVGPVTTGSTKTITLPIAGLQCQSTCGAGCRLNTDYPAAQDKFQLTVSGQQLTVQRLDAATPWGMNLIVPCTPAMVLPITVGTSTAVTKIMTLPYSGLTCMSSCGKGCRLNTDNVDAPNTFQVTVSGKQLTIKRTDSAVGWAMNLIIPCMPAVTPITVGTSAAVSKAVTLPDSGLTCVSPCGKGCRLNSDFPDAADTFQSTVNGKQLTVKRTDANAGWGMNLVVPCLPAIVPVTVGTSATNTKTVTLPVAGLTCKASCGAGCRLNTDFLAAADSFALTVSGTTLTIKRTDSTLGWSMNLIVPCMPSAAVRNAGRREIVEEQVSEWLSAVPVQVWASAAGAIGLIASVMVVGFVMRSRRQSAGVAEDSEMGVVVVSGEEEHSPEHCLCVDAPTAAFLPLAEAREDMQC